MKIKVLFGIVMPSKDTKIFQFNQYQHSDKSSDLEPLIKIILKNYPQQK